MTEPKGPAPDETEPIAPAADGGDPADVAPEAPPAVDDDAVRAEAEAAAMAADELGGEDEPDGNDVDEGEDEESDDEADEAESNEAIGDEAAAGAAAVFGSDAIAGPSADRAGRTGRAPKVVTPATIIDPSIRVSDPASKFFVIGTVLVFVLIFGYGAILGTGGVLTPFHSPSPE
ncbi:MAG: hypothetical protein QOI00_2043, partial [Chloroflexota bacterium]|nr:hypothetical protein [Chloroflexota bacterium]